MEKELEQLRDFVSSLTEFKSKEVSGHWFHDGFGHTIYEVWDSSTGDIRGQSENNLLSALENYWKVS